MFVKIGEFKGKPTISLMETADDRYPFTFGLAKAKLAVKGIEAVKAFIAKFDKPIVEGTEEITEVP